MLNGANHNDVSEIFRSNLTRMLREKKVTAAALSREAGLNLRAVTDIIEGRAQSPRLSTIYLLCRVLDVSLDEMISSEAPRIEADHSGTRIHPEVEKFLSSLSEEEQEQLLESIRKLAGYWKR